jgi:osmotically inducible protein OsmC
MQRKATVVWKGGEKGGATTNHAGASALGAIGLIVDESEQREPGADPAELFAAAHAGSFSLALSRELGLAPSARGHIETTVTLTMEDHASGLEIAAIHLHVVAKLPVTQGVFIDAAVRAKTACAISNIVRVNISMSAKLESDLPAGQAMPIASGHRA